jgi:D-sedoheptulose 7-phosphate isomerase
MENLSVSIIRAEFLSSADMVNDMLKNDDLIRNIEAVTDVCVTALKSGRKLLFMGNGGSAADCQHLAGEMVSRFAFDRPGLPAFALTVDSSVMTAIGNDYGFEHLFARQIRAVGQSGDVLFSYSTSGRSPNILAGIAAGKAIGAITIGMAGNQKAAISSVVDYLIEIPSASTPKIQEGHLIVGHIICGLIEARMFASPK